MLKSICLVIATWFVSSCAYAGNSYFVVAMSRSANPAYVKIEIPADYVVVPVSISSDDKDPLRNLENLQSTKIRLTELASKHPSIRVRYGTQSLMVSARDESKFSSYSSANTPSTADIYLIAPLGKDRDAFKVTKELITFLRSLPISDQDRFRFGTTSLGLDDPEQYRVRLLPLIAKEVERTRKAIGNSQSFEVSGLESPVSVIQQDEKNVAVFIPFRLNVGH
jgi:hypothetical protein